MADSLDQVIAGVVAQRQANAVHVLVSDVGMNGHVIHGVFAPDPPSQQIIDMARDFCRGWTGYGDTAVVTLQLNSQLPCGGQCTRKPTGVWADCYCYVNRCNDRDPS